VPSCLVCEQANTRQLSRGKVPIVCAVIDSVTARGVDAGITLRDPTGNISPLLHDSHITAFFCIFTFVHKQQLFVVLICHAGDKDLILLSSMQVIGVVRKDVQSEFLQCPRKSRSTHASPQILSALH